MGKEAQEIVQVLEKQQTEKENIDTKRVEIEEILSGFQNYVIEDDEDYELVAEGLKEIKGISKEIEERRKKITQPINGALREFNSWFKPAQTLLMTTESFLKRMLAEYVSEKEKQSRLAMLAASQASQAGDFDAAHEAAKGIVERPTAQGITHVRYFDYEIEDFEKVPRAFLAVDHSAVKIYIKNAGKDEPAPIPGIRFVEKDRTIARA